MEKKVKFSDNPTVSKIVYGVVIALLCISAIVVGIIAANNRRGNDVTDPPASDDGNNTQTPGDNEGGDGNGNGTGNTDNKQTAYIAPVAGKVIKGHSTTTPVYSTTLEEWRIHTGIDIMTEAGADVFACESGEVTKVYKDPLLGVSIEITHADGVKSVYKNLSGEVEMPAVGTKVEKGEKIGEVGDSAIMEIADEAHLHFEMIADDKQVDPLDYITKESQQSSLGITEE